MSAKNLGEILLEQGVIDRDALDRALQLQGRRLGEILIEEKLADPVAIANALKFQARSTSQRRSSRLSVHVKDLDDLLLRLEALEENLGPTTSIPHGLVSLRNAIEMLLLEPVESLFKKATWVARHAAEELGKKITLTSEGAGLIIDRSLVDDLSDVLLHLVRNAVDHGIESPETRIKAGKLPEGLLRVSLATLEGRLVLTLTDDGQGVDEDRVYATAVAAKLIDRPRDQVSSDELFKLLFTPGFSTAAGVSHVSGRGVGLDVVEATVIRLGGEVKVHSKRGVGCTFTVRVPLLYARMSILPLRVGSEWIAVNAAAIAGVDATSGDADVLSPASLFSENSSSGKVVVQCLDGKRWAFDEVGQPEYVMVRESSAFAKGSHGVIGNARMANGRGVLLVDLGLLATLAEKSNA